MSEFKRYRRKQVAELKTWELGDDLSGVSISDADRQAGSPKAGDMIARNPKNHSDKWLVAADYFKDNFAVDLTKFQEFDDQLGPSVEGIIPGALCTKITVVFVDPEGTQCSLGFVREGFADPDEDSSKEVPLDEFGDPLYPEEV